ncbi:hypothetical protein R1flu_028558 [Riccia fluitans]|uniref:Uncharacterized protein n=1 Tax=Riccia fluitans TaxID=41844 RepID=A0ABD1XMK6_9MARC
MKRPHLGDSEGPAENHLKVMVLVSRKSKSVLYIECGKDFVDILLSILVISVGAILKRLEDAGLSTDVKNGLFMMYASLKSLEASSLTVDKEDLLEPSTSASTSLNFLLLQNNPTTYTCVRPGCSNGTPSERQLCGNCYVVPMERCSKCGQSTDITASDDSDPTKCSRYNCRGALKLHYEVHSKAGGWHQPDTILRKKAGGPKKGFVRKSITFLIKEDLSITKSGTITSLALLQSMKMANFQELDAREISVGRQEVLCLVRAALVSKTPLTDVFGPLFDANVNIL